VPVLNGHVNVIRMWISVLCLPQIQQFLKDYFEFIFIEPAIETIPELSADSVITHSIV
jgi:hypothetical protein